MNVLKKSMLSLSTAVPRFAERGWITRCDLVRSYCEAASKMFLEKSVNRVILMGRVGVNPQLRGTDSRPVVIFTLATNSNYRYESGDLMQKTEWHRIAVFKPHLRNTILEHLKKGTRVYIEGRLLYGEFNDNKGMTHQTTSIVANDVIFIGSSSRKDEEEVDALDEKELVHEKDSLEEKKSF